MSTFSRLDVLISNAGICPFHTFLDLPSSLWKRVQDVNLNGAFYVVQAAANQMAKQEPNPSTGQRGSIVAISSISALMGGGEQCHYTPTKAGIKSLMESTAIALGPLGIRCNSVLPGMFTVRSILSTSRVAITHFLHPTLVFSPGGDLWSCLSPYGTVSVTRGCRTSAPAPVILVWYITTRRSTKLIHYRYDRNKHKQRGPRQSSKESRPRTPCSPRSSWSARRSRRALYLLRLGLGEIREWS